MIDLTLVQSGLASVQSAIELTKIISGAGVSLEKAESRLKLAELLSALADAKISLAGAGAQISDLQEALRHKIDRKSTRTWFADGVYIVVDESNKSLDGPFCARCLDVTYKFVRPASDRGSELGMGYCPECKNKYPLWNAEAKMIEDDILTKYTG